MYRCCIFQRVSLPLIAALCLTDNLWYGSAYCNRCMLTSAVGSSVHGDLVVRVLSAHYVDWRALRMHAGS